MNVYTFSEARQKLAEVLDEARRKGVVRIKRRDGSEFEISPVHAKSSPLDVEGVDLGVSAEEIVSVVREMRARQAVER
jgi:PHD/YefM family antitoxin component YafN of YafNO toxin-antitoxin module